MMPRLDTSRALPDSVAMDWTMIGIALFVVFDILIVIVVIALVTRSQRRAREAALRALGDRLGGGNVEPGGFLGGRPVLSASSGGRGLRLWYTKEGGGKNSPPRCYVHCEIDSRGTLQISIDPEGILGMFGLQIFPDVQVGIPEIDKAFSIRSPEAGRAAAFVQSHADALRALGRARLSVSDGQLRAKIHYGRGGIPPIEEDLARIQTLTDLAQALERS